MSGPNYSAGLVKKAQRFADAQLRAQQAMQSDVVVPNLGRAKLNTVSPEWYDKSATNDQTNSVKLVTDQVDGLLNSRFPYTYPIPQETKFDIKRRFTDENGFANFGFLGKDVQIGKAYVTPEYWEFLEKEIEREEAMALKAFQFNTMLADFDRPTGKQFWKKRNPELFQELKDALIFKHQNQFVKAMIALEGPQTEEEMRFIYNSFVNPKQYATIQNMPGAIEENGDNWYNNGTPTSENLQNTGIYTTYSSNRNTLNPESAKIFRPFKQESDQ